MKCVWASIDENGRARGGRAGDQTGKEVRVGNWYNFGQNAVYRWKDRSKAKKFAEIAEAVANNPADGYDQGQRTTLDAELKKLNWNYKKLKTPCECDCSSFIVAIINCVMKKELLSPNLYTGNLGGALMETGMFERFVGAKYCGSPDYLMTGDIINRPYSHVIAALQNGSKVTEKKEKKKTNEQIAQEVIDGKWGVYPLRKKRLEAAGYNYNEVRDIVNDRLAKKKKKAVREIAQEIVNDKGNKKWGTGAVRKAKLEKAGYDYNAVQKEVNKLLGK